MGKHGNRIKRDMERLKLQLVLKLINQSNGLIVFALKQGWKHGSIIPGFSAGCHLSLPQESSAFTCGIHFQNQELTQFILTRSNRFNNI